jgi:hypothetical protein
MDQVSYRGYARSIGFDPVKAPYGALDRIQERDNRTIRGMEENRREIKQVRDEYGAGLERKFNLEQQNSQQNYAWETKLKENRQQAIQKNAEILVQNELTQGKNISQTLEGLSKFSTTISETLTEYKKAKDEQDTLNGYMEVASGEFDPKRLQQQAAGETVLQSSGQATDTVAGELQKVGASPDVVMGLLTGNKARDYGRLKAYMEMSMSEFPGYAQSKLDEMGAVTAADRTAAMPTLFGEFLKDRGLFGLKADFMAKGLMQMRGTYNALIDDARRADVINNSETLRDEALTNLARSKDGETLNAAFLSLSRTYRADGKTPIGRAGAKELIYKELGDTTRYSDQDVERILSEAQTDQGQSWKARFTRDYDELINLRRQDAQKEFGLLEAEERQKNKEAEKQLLEWTASSWNGDQKVLQDVIKQAETQGIPTDRLKSYLAFSNEQRSIDFWTEQFDAAYEQGTLTTEDVDQPGVPATVRQTYRARAQELEKARGAAGISQDVLKNEFTDAVKSNLIGDSTNKTAHFSARSAADYALRLYNSKFKTYAKTMEPGQASEKARNDVLTAIQKKSGKFAVTASADAKGTQAFYGAFTPGKHPGAPRYIDAVNASQAVKEFRNNPSVINQRVLVSPAMLADINNRLENGRPISVPLFFNDLAKTTQNMTATDILNAQLKAAGYKTKVTPGFKQQLQDQLNDPRLKAIFENNKLTQDNLNTAIIGSGNAPATVRTGNAGYTDVMSLGNAAGFAFPQVMAAMWALESGWGKYHSGKNNVFNIKARPGQGTMKNGSYWRDYASPLESAKDFMNLMTDPRYAPGLKAAKTPRQAIEAIAAGGYAGGEAAYPGKIVRIMQQMGVNVDQPFTRANKPGRNTAYMRPTLAYITSDLGSPGQSHLDIKQQDNPNTPQNEFRMRFGERDLDQYVTVQDPEFGNIPVGELRKRLPGRGDSFDQHLARGSHGIDYPTAMGSKVFVRNGARVVSNRQTRWGSMVIIQLPDGRRFSFLHGKSV